MFHIACLLPLSHATMLRRCFSDTLCLCSSTRRTGGPGRVGVGLSITEKESTSVLFLVRVHKFLKQGAEENIWTEEG
jgi:hypothetical protein